MTLHEAKNAITDFRMIFRRMVTDVVEFKLVLVKQFNGKEEAEIRCYDKQEYEVMSGSDCRTILGALNAMGYISYIKYDHDRQQVYISITSKASY